MVVCLGLPLTKILTIFLSGYSYGSLLGVTAAAMFPDKVDRMVLDGVLNAFNYYDRSGLLQVTPAPSHCQWSDSRATPVLIFLPVLSPIVLG